MVIFKKDNYILGVCLGLVMPFISFFGYYFWKFRIFPFSEFLDALGDNPSLVTAISIPCLLLNIVLFTVYINGRNDKTAKGIFFVTIIYAIAALAFKFLA